ncbi:hypothetical protein K9M59_01280 [Candidatus Gracilibacteria bacterium]|nr:hypothetical protein [Candidatus Gracilibacteria bacterium]MCF7819200.1 hypothetical protein [Candidatus Gracilibacteria bacterium]
MGSKKESDQKNLFSAEQLAEMEKASHIEDEVAEEGESFQEEKVLDGKQKNLFGEVVETTKKKVLIPVEVVEQHELEELYEEWKELLETSREEDDDWQKIENAREKWGEYYNDHDDSQGANVGMIFEQFLHTSEGEVLKSSLGVYFLGELAEKKEIFEVKKMRNLFTEIFFPNHQEQLEKYKIRNFSDFPRQIQRKAEKVNGVLYEKKKKNRSERPKGFILSAFEKDVQTLEEIWDEYQEAKNEKGFSFDMFLYAPENTHYLTTLLQEFNFSAEERNEKSLKKRIDYLKGMRDHLRKTKQK